MAGVPKIRKSGQVVQDHIEYVPDNNGWPEPLTDPSTPYKIGLTNGKNGEQKQVDTKTSQDTWSRPEGDSSGSASQPDTSAQRASGEKTSQPIWSLAEGQNAKGGTQPNTDGDSSVRSSDPLKTSQQAASDHHRPEGGESR